MLLHCNPNQPEAEDKNLYTYRFEYSPNQRDVWEIELYRDNNYSIFADKEANLHTYDENGDRTDV